MRQMLGNVHNRAWNHNYIQKLQWQGVQWKSSCILVCSHPILLLCAFWSFNVLFKDTSATNKQLWCMLTVSCFLMSNVKHFISNKYKVKSSLVYFCSAIFTYRRKLLGVHSKMRTKGINSWWKTIVPFSLSHFLHVYLLKTLMNLSGWKSKSPKRSF